MTFLTLDDKNECIGYYCDGELIFDQKLAKNQNRTWKYSREIHNSNMLYANIFCNGKDFSEVCPERLEESWKVLNSKAKSYIRSFVESKVSLKENCFYDLVPKQFLLDYCDVKCEIVEHVLDTYEKPIDYDFKVDLEQMIDQMKYSKINLDFEYLKKNQHEPRTLDFIQKYSNKENFIVYNQYSSKTGRLTTEENSFPILNISKVHREAIKPTNDFFVDIDYNAAEVRTFLALNGFKQPTIDIHEWNKSKFGYADRNTAKNDFISWLYGKKNPRESEFKKIYNTDKLKSKYWDGTHIVNHYGTKIESDEFHAINYIVQSTTAGLALRQAIKVNKLLKGCKSKITAVIHDNIIIDMKSEEKDKIKQIIDSYTMTEFGKFQSSVKIGKSLSEMRKIL